MADTSLLSSASTANICSVCNAEETADSDSEILWLGCSFCANWAHASCLSVAPEVCNSINKNPHVLIKCDSCLSSSQSTQTPRMPRENPNISRFMSAVDLASGGDPDPVIVYGYKDPLSNMYPFNFLYNGILFNSVEQCYQFLKARFQGNLQLADQILWAPSSLVAKKLSKHLRPSTDSERNSARRVMERLLDQKAHQCPAFRDKLRKSGTAALIHSTYPSDKFWASGLKHDHPDPVPTDLPGSNVFGELLMALRQNLKDEDAYLRRSKPRRQPTNAPTANRQPATSNIVCYSCKKPGHKSNNCRFNNYRSHLFNSHTNVSRYFYNPSQREHANSNRFQSSYRPRQSHDHNVSGMQRCDRLSGSYNDNMYSDNMLRNNTGRSDVSLGQGPPLPPPANPSQLCGVGQSQNSNGPPAKSLGQAPPAPQPKNLIHSQGQSQNLISNLNQGYGHPNTYLAHPGMALVPQPHQQHVPQPSHGGLAQGQNQITFNPAYYGGYVDENAYIAPFDYLDYSSYPFLGQRQMVPTVVRQHA